MAEKYKSIGLKETEYEKLADAKRSFEQRLGRPLAWPLFLQMLASIRILEREEHTMHLEEDEQPMTEAEMAEAGVKRELGIPIMLPEEQIEDIANRVANKILEKIGKQNKAALPLARRCRA